MDHITYSFFCDESGMFHDIDTHVICPLILLDKKKEYFPKYERLWNYLSPNITYRRFHAVKRPKSDVQRIVEGIFDRILIQKDVYAAYIFHKSNISYGFDFYLGMVYHLVIWEISRILEKEIRDLRGDSNRQKQIQIQVYLAKRTSFNNRYFERCLQDVILKNVRKLVNDGYLNPDQISFNIEFYMLDVAENPCLVISDAFCHIIRAYLHDPQSLKRKLKQKIEKLTCRKVEQNELDNSGIKSLIRDLISHRKSDKKTEAETLLETVKKATSFRNHIRLATIESILSPMLEQPSWYRTANFYQLYEEARRAIRENRDYQTGERLVKVLFSLLDWERKWKAGDISRQMLDESELKTSDLYLMVNNHKGYNLIDDPRIIRANKLSEKIMYEPSTWGTICTFYNHLAVALQNVFHFQKAIESLTPRICYFEKETQNPFVSAGMKAREIGALFGTHAQSLAFDAHCRFFDEGDTALQKFEDAELLFLLASDHFIDEEDKAQNDIYLAHLHMQRYILTQRVESLNKAVKLIEPENNDQPEVNDFINALPDKVPLSAYRVGVLLKLAYLREKPPDWLDRLIGVMLDGRERLRPRHPMEQIIPYTIMLCPDKATQRELSGIIKKIPFPKNIIDAIRWILILQTTYEFNQKVERRYVTAIHDSITGDIRPQWEAYGLNRVLESYLKPAKIDRWHVGPMEVLPFNYC